MLYQDDTYFKVATCGAGLDFEQEYLYKHENYTTHTLIVQSKPAFD